MIYYCTNDLLSAHTNKRCSYFEYYGIKYELLGISNLSNDDIKQSNKSKFTTKNRGFSRYFFRLYYALRIILDLRKKKDAKVILRGFEFLFWITLLKKNFFFELTDIPNVVFNNRILMRILTHMCSRTSIISTSPAYLQLLQSDSRLIWHNVPFLDFDYKREVALSNINNRVIYAGYLRGLKTLNKEYKWLYSKIDFFGKKNIRYSSVEILDENYFGEYFFDDLNKIYLNYLFGYVSDFYGENSTYNLTNRLYEVIFNGCIPVHVKIDTVSKYFDDLGIFYISTKEQLEYACSMDIDKLKSIINSNQSVLREVVLLDFQRLNLHLNEK